MPICPICKKEFEVSKCQNRRQRYCSNNCKQKNWNKNHREKVNTNARNYYSKHKNDLRIQRCKSYAIRKSEFKLEIFKLLGNKCANPNCPIPFEKLDIRALHIDHIHGGGRKDREHSSLANYYGKILKRIKAGSKDYQLLCANCNWLKKYDDGEVLS